MNTFTNKSIEQESERFYNYLLAMVPGVGDVTISSLLDVFGNAKEIFHADEKKLSSVAGLSKKKINAIMQIRKRKEEIKNKIDKWKAQGIEAVFINEEDYPEHLKNLSDAPFCFFYKGRLPVKEAPTVAIVGARACTEYGKNAAYSFGKRLALQGIQIISGMAAGADVYGHKGALAGGGYTAGVLGCGVDICYPRINFATYTEMQKSGCLMSEVLPGTSPSPGLFPRRNRIIAALSDAVIITEAREKSGSLITADQALEQGKDVFAVPGRIGDSLSAGCLSLIRQGAYPLTCVDDVLSCESIKRKMEKKNKKSEDGEKKKISRLVSDKGILPEKKVFEVLTDIPKNINRIMYETAIDYEEAAQAIISLELHGLLRSVSAGLYVRGEVEI